MSEQVDIASRTPRRARKVRHWRRRYFLVGLLAAVLHYCGSSVVEREAAPTQSNLFWNAIGPDGGHEPTGWLRAYGFPIQYIYNAIRKPVYFIPTPAWTSLLDGTLWGLCLYGLWQLFSLLGDHYKRLAEVT